MPYSPSLYNAIIELVVLNPAFAQQAERGVLKTGCSAVGSAYGWGP